MYLVINTLEKYRYIRMLHNYRDGKRCKHKPIMQLGRYEEQRFRRLKKELKDWKPMDRADTIIKEMQRDVANVKKHARPFKINYHR